MLSLGRILRSLAGRTDGARAPEPPPEKRREAHEVVFFRCNVCGTPASAEFGALARETPSCPACASTVRMRALVHVLSTELLGESLPLPEFPVRRDLRGLGMSDWPGYAGLLAEKFAYQNCFLDHEPTLDVRAPPAELLGTLDFLVSSDVFEHVAPPVETAFRNARRLLAPGGVLVFSVPYMRGGDNIEHFPDLFDYSLTEIEDKRTLVNVTQRGERQVFENLVFHGGEGLTLEMRVFSEPVLRAQLEEAGFDPPRIYGASVEEYGIFWSEPLSLPMALRPRVGV